MQTPDLKQLLPHVEALARQAGAEIMRRYAAPDIHSKEDGSAVTDADLAAEKIILPALQALTPGIPIISEERVAAGEVPDISGGTFWTVDPLDGTQEFIDKTGAFVVAIALVADHRPVLGVIYHPAMNLLYSAAGPGSATRVEADGVRHAVGDGVASPPALRILINERHTDLERVKGYLTQQFGSAVQVDGKSGILRACQVADGRADMAVVAGKRAGNRTAFWDVAPGHAIIEAAGGIVETLDGKPLLYNDADLHVGPHAAISPRRAQKGGTAPPPAP